MTNYLLPILLALPFAGSLLFTLMPRNPGKLPWMVIMAFTTAAAGLLGYMTAQGPESFAFSAEWMPVIGLNFSLWLDGPALFFAWLVIAMAWFIFFYAGFYMDPEDSVSRFFGTMLFFMGSMLGVVISRNALLMFMFWELTSISSFILIGHWHEKASARAGALQALIVTGIGGLCLMCGIAGWFFVLGGPKGAPADALEWDVLWANREALVSSPYAFVFMLLVLVGAFTKSAQFPFHFWLPGAMEAPTPVSAFLHAATMVKAGIYLLGRIYPIYGEWLPWLVLVGSAGVLTMLVGGFMAILSNDLKQLLAHSTVSQLGIMTAYYGFGFSRLHGEKLPLDLMLVASHALFKGPLFMIVGIIDHAAHTREWKRLGGLFRHMPVTAVLSIIACASMAGFPLTFGFVAKELFLKASLKLHSSLEWLNYALPAIAIFASLFTVAYCYRFAISPFFGKPRDPSIDAHEGGLGLLFSPALLIGLMAAAGIWVPILEHPIASTVRSEFYGTASSFQVAFFHHFDKLTVIAIFLFTVGFALFLAGGIVERIYQSMKSPAPFKGTYQAIFDRAVPNFAEWLTGHVQVPSLSRNILLTFTVLFVLTGAAGWVSGFDPQFRLHHQPPPLLALGAVFFICVSVLVALTHEVALVRLIALGPVGLLVALFFLIYKAPDLALTQILIEVVTLIVLLLLLFRLPQKLPRGLGLRKSWFPAIISVVGGLAVGALTYTATLSEFRSTPTFPNQPTVAEYYLENSKHTALEKFEKDSAEAHLYPGAEAARSGGGANVVNVILVDFRGFDTLGEISVLGIAALGVFVLLLYNRKQRIDDSARLAARQRVRQIIAFDEGPERPPTARRPMWTGYSVVLKEVSRIVPSIMILIGLVLFLSGHNAPGGGFIAGLMVSVAVALLFIAFRKSEIPGLFRADYMKLIPAGLTFAIGIGLVAVLLGAPFMTSAFGHFHMPLMGEMELATAAVFDLGVFLVVVGVTLLIIQKFGGE